MEHTLEAYEMQTNKDKKEEEAIINIVERYKEYINE